MKGASLFVHTRARDARRAGSVAFFFNARAVSGRRRKNFTKRVSSFPERRSIDRDAADKAQPVVVLLCVLPPLQTQKVHQGFAPARARSRRRDIVRVQIRAEADDALELLLLLVPAFGFSRAKRRRRRGERHARGGPGVRGWRGGPGVRGRRRRRRRGRRRRAGAGGTHATDRVASSPPGAPQPREGAAPARRFR